MTHSERESERARQRERKVLHSVDKDRQVVGRGKERAIEGARERERERAKCYIAQRRLR